MDTITFEIWRNKTKKRKAAKIGEVTAQVDWTPRPYPEPQRIDVMAAIGKNWCRDHEAEHDADCITYYEFDVDNCRITYDWADECPRGGGCGNCWTNA